MELLYDYLSKENNAEDLKKDIFALLKKNKLSLAQTNALFRDIIEELQLKPLTNL